MTTSATPGAGIMARAPQAFRDMWNEVSNRGGRGLLRDLDSQGDEADQAWQLAVRTINQNPDVLGPTNERLTAGRQQITGLNNDLQDSLARSMQAGVNTYGQRTKIDADAFERKGTTEIRKGDAASRQIAGAYGPLAESLERKGDNSLATLERMVGGAQGLDAQRLATLERIATRPKDFVETVGGLLGPLGLVASFFV